MGILSWIIIGLLAGLLARAIVPGRQPAGIIVTLLLGVAGGLIGGWIGGAITGRGLSGFSFWSLLLAVAGATLLLFIYELATGGRKRMGGKRGRATV